MLDGHYMLSPCMLPALQRAWLGVRQLCLFMELLLTGDSRVIFLQEIVEEATQRMLELHEGWKQVRAHPMKRHICSSCSVQ